MSWGIAMAEMNDTELEHFFHAAQAAAPQPSEALMARILRDAEAQQPKAQPAAPHRARGGWLSGVLRGLGGWPALTGLATATVAGVWIGYAAPSAVSTLASDIWPSDTTGYDVVDLIPSMDTFLAEGGA